MCSYQIDRLEIMNHEVKSQEARDRIKVRQEAIEDLEEAATGAGAGRKGLAERV